MPKLEERLKKLWHNERRPNDHLDGIDEALLRSNTSIYQRPFHFHLRFYLRCVYRLSIWICAHKLLVVILVFGIIPICLYALLVSLSRSQAFLPNDLRTPTRRLLLVVAHPDDECLFFAPTLRGLHQQLGFELSLLVFSLGNNTGQGKVRALELLGSCAALQVPKERCVPLDLPTIQDNPTVWWPEKQLIPIIHDHMDKWKINILVSFDNGGISGHLNHRALNSAIRKLVNNKNMSRNSLSYELHSVSLLRKYSSLLDLYPTILSFTPRLLRVLLSKLTLGLISGPDRSRVLLVNTLGDYLTSRAAFASHNTQYSWDRHLYLLISRYMFVNELKLIDSSTK